MIVLKVEMGTYKVGYWMKPKKAKRINLVRIEEILSTKYNIELVELNLSDPDTVLVDVIFHKMSDLVLDSNLGKESAVKILSSFKKYLNRHPRVKVFDPLPNIEIVLDRVNMMQAITVCSDACPKGRRFYSSGYIDCTEAVNRELICADMKANNFNYPLICKSRISQGSLGHDMCIILTEDGLKDVKPNSVLVPFIDHDAVLYKVFMVGTRYHTVTRPSITTKKLLSKNVDVYHFHSDTVSKITEAASSVQHDIGSAESFCCNQNLTEHQDSLVQEWVNIISNKLGLTLVGFDLIFEAGTDKPFIIDINYFPGYDGYSEFHEVLSELLFTSIHTS